MAKKKYTSGADLNNSNQIDTNAYVTWGDDLGSKQEALKKLKIFFQNDKRSVFDRN